MASVDWSALGAIVTAGATIVLAYVTAVLVRETKRLSDATNRPHVIATLEANTWSMVHMDIWVENTGTGPAYDIEVDFDPPLVNDIGRKDTPFPFKNISVLKPGQSVTSFACSLASIHEKTFKVSIGWKRKPNDATRETYSYEMRMSHLAGISELGRPPEVRLAEALKKLQEDFRDFSGRRFSVQTFDARDRLHEQRHRERDRRRRRRESQTVTSPE